MTTTIRRFLARCSSESFGTAGSLEPTPSDVMRSPLWGPNGRKRALCCLSPRFEFAECGTHQLKGIAEPRQVLTVA